MRCSACLPRPKKLLSVCERPKSASSGHTVRFFQVERETDRDEPPCCSQSYASPYITTDGVSLDLEDGCPRVR